MNRRSLESLFAAVDNHLSSPATMVVYGAAAFMMLGEEGRSSIDLDVAGPYCKGDVAGLREAIAKAGYMINPPPEIHEDHVEWVGIERLSLELPGEEKLPLWQGKSLTVITVSPPALIASKLIRYDETDQSDIRSICFRMRVTWEQVRDAVVRLPYPFRNDAIVLENLENLKNDLMMWEGTA